MAEYKSPLKKARGLGSAKTGVDHWLEEKISFIGTAPLLLWLFYNLAILPSYTYEALLAFVSKPLNGFLLSVLLLFSFYYSVLHAVVVIEDYVHNEFKKLASIIFLKLASILAVLSAIYSILMLVIKGA